MRKKTVAGLVALAVALVSAGAITGAYAAEVKQASPDPGFLTAEQTLAEFKSIGHEFERPLPEGVVWPSIPPAELRDSEGQFEIGFLESVASLYWLCAWENAALDEPNSDVSRNAVKHLAEFSETAWFATYDPQGAWRSSVLPAAAKGSFDGFKQEQDSTCGYYHLNQ